MKVTIDTDLCESTGCCEMVCPENVFEKSHSRVVVVNAPACTNCWICVDHCVSGAIAIE